MYIRNSRGPNTLSCGTPEPSVILEFNFCLSLQLYFVVASTCFLLFYWLLIYWDTIVRNVLLVFNPSKLQNVIFFNKPITSFLKPHKYSLLADKQAT